MLSILALAQEARCLFVGLHCTPLDWTRIKVPLGLSPRFLILFYHKNKRHHGPRRCQSANWLLKLLTWDVPRPQEERRRREASSFATWTCDGHGGSTKGGSHDARRSIEARSKSNKGYNGYAKVKNLHDNVPGDSKLLQARSR